jgi:hypothetical protein
MKPILIFIAVSLVICLGAWISGFNFDRGISAFLCYIYCIVLGSLVAFWGRD